METFFNLARLFLQLLTYFAKKASNGFCHFARLIKIKNDLVLSQIINMRINSNFCFILQIWGLILHNLPFLTKLHKSYLNNASKTARSTDEFIVEIAQTRLFTCSLKNKQEVEVGYRIFTKFWPVTSLQKSKLFIFKKVLSIPVRGSFLRIKTITFSHSLLVFIDKLMHIEVGECVDDLRFSNYLEKLTIHDLLRICYKIKSIKSQIQHISCYLHKQLVNYMLFKYQKKLIDRVHSQLFKFWFYNILILLLEMKKKDNLLQVIKKEETYHLSRYLCFEDLIKLSFTCKRYYSQLFPIINALKLDEQQTKKPIKSKNNKNKNKKTQQIVDSIPETQVDIEKLPLSKFAKRINKADFKKWKKIDQLDFYNSYLNKKMESKGVIFYKNQETNELIFINRSMVDPNLNYNKGGFGEDFLSNSIYEHIFTEGQVSENDFSSQQAILKRQKEILEKINFKKEEESRKLEICFEDELGKALSMKRFGIILCFGGSFSFGIFQNGRCILHKSDKKYVCRQKAGERQLNKDKQSGSGIQSIGSQIRRDQEKKHVINVGQILKEHNKELQQCEIIFLQAPGLNRLFVINENENLNGLQDKLRSVCVTAKKANFTEIEALYQTISQVHVVRAGSKEEFEERKRGKKEK